MAKNTHNHYETTFIVDSIFEDERVDAIVNKYSNFFTKNGGEVLKTEKWGRRKLSYSIKKRQTGSYVSIEFTAEPSVIAKLERAYHLDDDILRFLTVSFDKKTLEERNVYLVKKEQIAKEREAAALQSAAQQTAQQEQSAVADTVAEAKSEE
jgi:small subunit ribosomal protein S6